MEAGALHLFLMERLKGAQPDVQRHKGDLRAAPAAGSADTGSDTMKKAPKKAKKTAKKKTGDDAMTKQ